MSKASTETDGNIYIYVGFETDTEFEIWQAQTKGWGHNWASTSL
jgi:hypothetical protein